MSEARRLLLKLATALDKMGRAPVTCEVLAAAIRRAVGEDDELPFWRESDIRPEKG